MASFNNPKVTNPILGDVNQIHDLLNVLAQANPALADNPPEGAKRIWEYTENGKTYFRIEKLVKGAWVSLGSMSIAATSLQGYVPSTTAKANTIPVYNSAGQLVGNITGNAPTASKWAKTIKIDIGGIAASTAQNMDGSSNVTIPINSITLNNAADTAVNGVLTPKHGGSGRTDGASLDVVVPSLAGDVLAKAYGQIGMSKAINYDTNADSLIVEGTYMLSADTSANWDKNKWPTNYPWNGMLRVFYTGSRIHQEYVSLAGGSWFRSSGDKGASWAAWQPIGAQRQFYVIYISKSGNDANMGLSSSYPVLTFSRAMQVAVGLCQQGSSQPYIYFNFGEGNWGNISIRNCPFLVIFRPYDGGTATAYSTSLPVFGNITVENSYLWFGTCVAGYLIATNNGFINVNSGYKRVGGLQSNYNSVVYIASQNAATNLIDFTGGNYIPFYAITGGIIYAQYIHLRLCGNLTTRFLYIAMLGRITVYNGQTVYDATAFSNSGRKYEIYQGGMFNSCQTNGNLSWLNALPGAQAGVIDDSCYINGRAMANVLKTGDTMTGALNIKVNGPQLHLYDTGLNRNAAPAANLYRRTMRMFDAQNAESGAIQAGFTTAQRTHMGLFAQRVISGQTKYAEIGGAINNDGTVVGYAPTPADASNTNDIATTGWVRKIAGSLIGSGSGSSVVDGKTISNVTMASGTINFSNVQLSGTPPFTDNDNKIPNLYWVNNLCSGRFYGMCPYPQVGTSTYLYNTWYQASSNGWVFCSFQGVGMQYWRVGKSTSSYNSLNAGNVKSAFTCPIQNKTYFQVYDAGCNGIYLGWTEAIGQHDWNGARPTARANTNSVSPGHGRIYLKIVGGDSVEGFGDLTSLADFLGLEFPDPDHIEFDTSRLVTAYQDGLDMIQSEYEKGIEAIEKDFESEMKLALFEAERIIGALYKTKEAAEYELPYEQELQLTVAEIEREYDAKKGYRITALQESIKIKYQQFQDEYSKLEFEFEGECIRKTEEAIRIRDAVCEKAAEMADMIIDPKLWNENFCAAHLEDGKIVLGPTKEVADSIMEHYIQERLAVYDKAIMKLEREKRFAVVAMKRSRMGDTEVLSRYAGRQEEIEDKLMQWDIYAAEISDMPNKKGYPWDIGGKATPWPELPTFDA